MRILDRIKIVVPSDEILENYNNLVKSIFDSVMILKNQNQRLKEARDILLPRLMSGMIEV